MYRIFLVEDDPTIAQAVAEALTGWGYTVTRAVDFAHVATEFAACDPQLVLLDISLPFFNGYHWCQQIRRVSQVPVVFLSSAADGMNIVLAMQMGGDDFIAKPVELPVLVAKLQALLRRAYDLAAPAKVYACGDRLLRLDAAAFCVDDRQVELSKNEFRILQQLLEHRGQVVTRGELMTRLWESDAFVDENTLSVNVARLRHRLAEAGLPSFVHTRKGEGYFIPG